MQGRLSAARRSMHNVDGRIISAPTKEIQRRRKMYKLIAIDLDGTLLNSYGNVSERNRKAVKAALDKGIEVVICSGRVTSSCENIANEIEANNYLIAGNGAQVYDIQNQQVIYDKYLNKQKVLDIVKICEENSIYCNVYTENLIIAKSLKYSALCYNNENQRKEVGKKTNINIVEDQYKYIEESNINRFLKIIICDSDRVIFYGIMKKLSQVKGVEILEVDHMARKLIHSGTEEIPIEYFYTEITNENVNKWTALQFLIKHLNIAKEEVVAIGDNVNDKEMIANAGLGVSMDNAAQYVKEVAKEVVNDNNLDGVADAIERFVLQQYYN